ncbi:MAG: hypothetical protein V3U10_01615 [Bacteroidota bacterium]
MMYQNDKKDTDQIPLLKAHVYRGVAESAFTLVVFRKRLIFTPA